MLSFYIVLVFDCAVLYTVLFLCVFVFYCVLGISILHFSTIVDNCIGCVPCLMFAFDFAFVFILQLDCIVSTSSVFFLQILLCSTISFYNDWIAIAVTRLCSSQFPLSSILSTCFSIVLFGRLLMGFKYFFMMISRTICNC